MKYPVKVALAAIVTAGVAASAGLFALHRSLPSDDGAANDPFLFLLLNPFVLTVMAPICLLGALIAYPVALWALQGRDFWKSIAVIAGVTVGVSVLVTPGLNILGFLPTLLAGIATIVTIRVAGLFAL
jgi:hypothetical protein